MKDKLAFHYVVNMVKLFYLKLKILLKLLKICIIEKIKFQIILKKILENIMEPYQWLPEISVVRKCNLINLVPK